MIEYRTHPLAPTTLLEELSFYCEVLRGRQIEGTEVMFGWDSNLDIDEMWQEMPMSPDEVVGFVLDAQQAGTVVIGKSDIFVSAGGIEITLCHESDLHIKAAPDEAHQFFERWETKGYAPYAVKPRT
jgi:hypothetical protein